MALTADQEQRTEVLKATLTRIIWQKDDRIIAKAQAQGRREFSVMGNMVEPKLGQLYEFNGKWEKNDRYGGFDLKFFSYRTVLPNDRVGVYNYLVRTAKWVGPETAEALIEKYGDDVLSILKTDPDRVIFDEIRGLTGDRTRELSQSLRDNEKLEHAMVEVGTIIGGMLGQSAVEKAIKKWGADAAHIIKRNAYRLTDLDGVGFQKADSVFIKTDGRIDSLKRHSRAVLHILEEQADKNGHTRVSRTRFNKEISALIGQLHPKALEHCRRAKAIRINDNWISLTRYAEAEEFVADRLTYFATQQLPGLKLNDEIRFMSETLEDDQLNAFTRAQVEPLLYVVGAPGTGKTYTVARIIALWRANGLSVKLAAPTGKAAKQISNAMSATISMTAETIHSLLGAQVNDDGSFGFRFNAGNRIPSCSAIVIDETSMVDIRLARSLFEALPNECRILIVGDHHQLPSVGPGAILRDSLAAKAPFVELRKIKRNAGLIVRACHAIKDGNTPQPAARLDLDAGLNWRHLEVTSSEEALSTIEQLLSTKLPSMGINPTWQTQIIAATNESGELSCATLNRVAKGIVNPGQLYEKLPFAINDKVVRTKNGRVKSAGDAVCTSCGGQGKSPTGVCIVCMGRGSVPMAEEVRIVNGDIGVVKNIDKDFIYVDFLYPDRSVKIVRRDHNLKMAYCMTCHKMQGSEVDVVIMPIRKSIMGMPMVTREWVYTAMSRAKRFIITIGTLQYLPMAIARIGNTSRTTALAEMLVERLNK